LSQVQACLMRPRLSVLDAITSTQQRLKLYTKVPPNGLVMYCGTIMTDEGKERRVTIDFEPFKPINTSLYLCDNKFHTEVGRAYLARAFPTVPLVHSRWEISSLLLVCSLAPIHDASVLCSIL
jgi:hypothetical protein